MLPALLSAVPKPLLRSFEYVRPTGILDFLQFRPSPLLSFQFNSPHSGLACRCATILSTSSLSEFKSGVHCPDAKGLSAGSLPFHIALSIADRPPLIRKPLRR